MTYLWQEPFTGIYAHVRQGQLLDAYEARVNAYRPPDGRGDPAVAREPPGGPRADGSPGRNAGTPYLSSRELARAATAYRLSTSPGSPIGHIVVPKLGIDLVVVDGATSGDLHSGPGRDLRSLMPGEGGLVYVAGHRTTYGAPFRHIDELRAGDPIFLELPYGRFEYRVTGHAVVFPTEVERLESRGREELALQASHPPYSARERLIVYARFASVGPPARPREA